MAYRFDAGESREQDFARPDGANLSFHQIGINDSQTNWTPHTAALSTAAFSPSSFSLSAGDLSGGTLARFAPADAHTGALHTGAVTGPTTLALDDIPDDDSTDVYLNVQEGQSIHSQLDAPGDHDFFGVHLAAGTTYEFTLVPDDTSGTTGPDMLMNVYDSEGNLITTFDGGSFGSTEHGTFMPDANGTYYIDVGGYLESAQGGYTLTGNIDDTPDINMGTPLDAIDWGGTENRVDTDGVKSSNGDDVIQFYFAQTGEVYESNLAGVVVAEDWQPYEKQAVYDALQQYDNIINVDYVEVDNKDDADFVFISHAFEPNVLGSMSPPNEPYEGQGEFNNVGCRLDRKRPQAGRLRLYHADPRDRPRPRPGASARHRRRLDGDEWRCVRRAERSHRLHHGRLRAQRRRLYHDVVQ